MREGRKLLPSVWHRETRPGPNRDTWQVARQAARARAEKTRVPQRNPDWIPTFVPQPTLSAYSPLAQSVLRNQECQGAENKTGTPSVLAAALHDRLRSRSYSCLGSA